MLYENAKDWLAAPQKRVLLFGMSGLGKTHVSAMLRDAGDWFHYSVDYRIGTRYLGEDIVDNFKREAMQNPFLRDLLLSDSIYIASNIRFNNLAPLSTYLGKPGDPARGGLPFDEYQRRQELHRAAEISAMLDTEHFISRARDLYAYENFVCDSSGSICEVVNPDDPEDPVLQLLSRNLLMVWIEGSDAHTAELVRRFNKAPKPMCYQSEFLTRAWADYASETGQKAECADPDAFIRWTFARALAHRQPRYAAMARNWGIRIAASDVASLHSATDFVALIGHALEARAN